MESARKGAMHEPGGELKVKVFGAAFTEIFWTPRRFGRGPCTPFLRFGAASSGRLFSCKNSHAAEQRENSDKAFKSTKVLLCIPSANRPCAVLILPCKATRSSLEAEEALIKPPSVPLPACSAQFPASRSRFGAKSQQRFPFVPCRDNSVQASRAPGAEIQIRARGRSQNRLLFFGNLRQEPSISNLAHHEWKGVLHPAPPDFTAKIVAESSMLLGFALGRNFTWERLGRP